MPFWTLVVWRANNALGNRLWRFLPYRLRTRWAREWIRAGSPRYWQYREVVG